jgi:hypothetical protein
MEVSFITDPFLGLVCRICQVAIGQKRNWNIARHVREHIKKQHGGSMDLIIGDWQTECDNKMRGMAKEQVAKIDLRGEQDFLLKFMLPESFTVLCCEGCQNIKCELVNGRGNHLSGCEKKVFIPKLTKIYIHKHRGPKGNRVHVNEEFDPRSDDLLHPVYHRLLTLELELNRAEQVTVEIMNQPPEPADLTAETETQEEGGQQESTCSVNQVVAKPKLSFGFSGPSNMMKICFENGLSMPENSRRQANYEYQTEYTRLRGTEEPELAEFLDKLFRPTVVDHYDGNWTEFASSMLALVSTVDSAAESGLRRVARDLFLNKYLPGLTSVNSYFKMKIATVGEFRPNNKMHSIRDRFLEVCGQMDQAEGTDDGSDTGVNLLELVDR